MLATEDTENTEERIKIKLSGLCELGGEETNMEMKKSMRYSTGRLTAEMRDTRYENGSALILVVVLTSLLAIVGVMFVMVARVDRIATSAISENKTLDSAVEAVIARISQELVLDVPGVAGAEYYDYPDANNAWLASLEPYEQAGNYYWRQISDVYNKFGLSLELDAKIIPDYQKPSDVGDSNSVTDYPADADGDGVADSRWIELEGINSSKGKTIYAAIRVIDNGGMLNVNTAYKFDPTGPGVTADDIDGSTQMQINLMALASLPGEPPPTSDHERDLLEARANYGIGGVDPFDLYKYEENVVWRYNEPNGSYTPFDISDELELRYRFLVNQEDIDTRLEELGPIGRRWGFREYAFRTPAGTGDLGEWFISAYGDGSLDPNYAYRHIGTTYNMDRIINPDGEKMLNVSKADAGSIYSTIKTALRSSDPNFKNVDKIAAQIAVNLIDFSDTDSNVATFDPPPPGGKTYYGFEQPCIYISELAHRFVRIPPAPGGTIFRSYAIELYKPYWEDDYPDPNGWRLMIGRRPGGPIGAPAGGKKYGIDWSAGKQFYVIQNESPSASLPEIDPNAVVDDNDTLAFDKNDPIELQRRIDDVEDIWITVDYIRVPGAFGGWLAIDANSHSIQRDIKRHKCIRRLWDSDVKVPTLGSTNDYTDLGSPMIQAHPENRLTNIGEIGMVFRKSAYFEIGQVDTDADVRINLADPNYHNIFQYLTVFDPSSDTINNDGDYKDGFENTDEIALNETPEFKIPGRININTAPWYVIAQLPWVTDKIAQAIVAYRDKLDMDPNGPDYYHDGANDSRYQETGIRGLREADGFASIGELATVVNDSGEDEYSMHYYELDSNDLEDFPDLTPNDDVADDFEERDVIFARLSNLVTVRSDVFTAYILVRIGADGPQKRVMAIFDRSDVYSDDGRVQIVALHPVADPR